MTICLGVLCDHGKKVIVASDRMLTGGDVEFEQDAHKVDGVTDGCVVLSAGSALEHVGLLRDVRLELQSRKKPSVSDVVEEVKRGFVEARKRRAEELYLKPLDMELSQFMTHQSRLAEPLALKLTRNIADERLELDLLVAGVDDTGGHLYMVRDPGTDYCFDAIGFCSIGSGEHHAELSFIRSEYSMSLSLERALFLAYQAKRDSEVAPGVGARFTDIVAIDETGAHFASSTTINALKDAYDHLIELRTGVHADVYKRVDGLKVSWADEKPEGSSGRG
jgi:20S proteasome alpha/beta subunit